MIEFLGYVFAYLLIGVLTMPLPAIVDVQYNDSGFDTQDLILFMLFWPILVPIAISFIYWAGWKALGEHFNDNR